MRISLISLLLISTSSAMTIPFLARRADSGTITQTPSGLQVITTANGATMLVGGATDVSIDGDEASVELEPNEITTDRGSDIILPAGTSIQVNNGGDLSIGGSEVTRGGQTIVP